MCIMMTGSPFRNNETILNVLSILQQFRKLIFPSGRSAEEIVSSFGNIFSTQSKVENIWKPLQDNINDCRPFFAAEIVVTKDNIELLRNLKLNLKQKDFIDLEKDSEDMKMLDEGEEDEGKEGKSLSVGDRVSVNLLFTRESKLKESKGILLNNYVVQIPCTKHQIEKCPTLLCTDDLDYNKMLLSRFCKSNDEWDVRSKEKGFSEVEIRKIFLTGEKLKFCGDLVDYIYRNRLDYDFAQKKYSKDFRNLPKEDFPKDCYEKVAFMSKHPQLLFQIQDYLIKKYQFPSERFFRITGEQTPARRQVNKKKFCHKDSQYAMGMITTGVGAIGLTMVECRNLIFVDLPFDHSTYIQGIGRPYRLGQERDVYTFLLATTSNGKDFQMRHLKTILLKDYVSKRLLRGIHFQDNLCDEKVIKHDGFHKLLSNFRNNEGKPLKFDSYNSMLRELVDELKQARKTKKKKLPIEKPIEKKKKNKKKVEKRKVIKEKEKGPIIENDGNNLPSDLRQAIEESKQLYRDGSKT